MTISLKEIMERLLREVDGDLRTLMLEDSSTPSFTGGPMYKAWELLPDPVGTITAWQIMRRLR